MNAPKSYPYRAFLSYSHNDANRAEQLAERLRRLNIRPIWDKFNPGGWPFLDEIKKQIAHAHLFVALLTRHSSESTWVNHEIGFAMGRSIPVLPLSLGSNPDGMATGIQAVASKTIAELLPRLTRPRIDSLVQGAEGVGVYESVDHVEARTEAIVHRCKQIRPLTSGSEERLRHAGLFGSFSIPPSRYDPLWSERDDADGNSEFRRERFSQERRFLEEYARRFGCDLVISPDMRRLPKAIRNSIRLTKRAIRARIRILHSFVEEMAAEGVDLRVQVSATVLNLNLLIVGDWFLAESTTPSVGGFRHTTVTSHAPTVLARLRSFDEQFDEGQWMTAKQAAAWLARLVRSSK